MRGLALSYPHGGEIDGKPVNAGNRYLHLSASPPLDYVEGITMRKLCCLIADEAIDDGAYVWDGPQSRQWIRGTCWHQLDQRDLGVVGRVNRLNDAGVWPAYEPHSDALGMVVEGLGRSESGTAQWTSVGDTAADPIASSVHNALQQAGYKTRTDYSDGDADREKRLHFTRGTRGPSVLGELGFHTNLLDAQRLSDPVELKKLASAIWRGLRPYVLERVG